MIDRVKFMETLRSIAEVAKIAEHPLTKEEIITYFDDIELTEEQIAMVLQYLENPQTEAESSSNEPEESKEETDDNSEEDIEESSMDTFNQVVENSKFLAMYLEDLAAISSLTKSEAQELYIRLIDGDSKVMASISDDWLIRVVEIAKTYSKHKVNYEDLIQEGNIGLITGIQDLLGSKKMIDVEEYLKESIQQAMENYIDAINLDDDWESTIIAKTTLINEARKALAEENVAIPSIEELADYTKIPKQEIEDILRLSKED